MTCRRLRPLPRLCEQRVSGECQRADCNGKRAAIPRAIFTSNCGGRAMIHHTGAGRFEGSGSLGAGNTRARRPPAVSATSHRLLGELPAIAVLRMRRRRPGPLRQPQRLRDPSRRRSDAAVRPRSCRNGNDLLMRSRPTARHALPAEAAGFRTRTDPAPGLTAVPPVLRSDSALHRSCNCCSGHSDARSRGTESAPGPTEIRRSRRRT